jgi:hypothetical protein
MRKKFSQFRSYSKMMHASNDVWDVIGSFFLFSPNEICGVFPFVSKEFRKRAMQNWSKFAHRAVFKVTLTEDNKQWVNNHAQFVRKIKVRNHAISETFPAVKSLNTQDLRNLQRFPNAQKLTMISTTLPLPLQHRVQYPKVRYLFLGAVFDDEKLSILESFPNLEYLKLFGFKVRNLTELKFCSKVRWLELDNCSQLESLAGLARLTQLEALKILNCQKLELGQHSEQMFDAAYVANLEYCRRLKLLCLNNARGLHNAIYAIPFVNNPEWISRRKLDWKCHR